MTAIGTKYWSVFASALCALVLLLAARPALATATYTYTGSAFAQTTDHSSCAVGICGDYSIGGRLTGNFTTAVALTSNLTNQDIKGSVLAFSFNDGLTTFDSSSGAVFLAQMTVSTDGTGNLSGVTISIVRWQSTPPALDGTIHQRVDLVLILDSGPLVLVNKNVTCTATFGLNCTLISPTSDSSDATATSSGTWVRTLSPQQIPTVSEWGMIIMFGLLTCLCMIALRRRADLTQGPLDPV